MLRDREIWLVATFLQQGLHSWVPVVQFYLYYVNYIHCCLMGFFKVSYLISITLKESYFSVSKSSCHRKKLSFPSTQAPLARK